MKDRRGFPFSFGWFALTALIFGGCTVHAPDGVPDPKSAGEVPLADLSQIASSGRTRIEAAREALRQLLEGPNASAESLGRSFGRLGMLYHAFHFRNEAAYCYERARSFQSSSLRWHYLLARVYQNQTELDKAYEVLLQGLEVEPRHVPSLIAVGEYLRRRNRLDEARGYFSKALDAQPRSATALMGLAQIEMANRRYEEALKWLDSALKLQPEAAALHYQAALAYRGLGDLARAKAHLASRGKSSVGLAQEDELLEEIDGLRSETRTLLTGAGDRAMASGDFAGAEREYRLVLANHPEDTAIRTKLGQALLRQGRLQPALEEFGSALRTDPGNANLHYNMGGMLMEAGGFSQAAAHFEKCFELEPKMTEALLYLGDALRCGGLFDRAVAPYRSFLERVPADRGALLGLGFTLIRLARYGEAAKVLEVGLAQSPQDPILCFTLARVLAAAPEGVRDGKRASALVEVLGSPNVNLDLLETAAMVHAALGQFEQAIKRQRSALAIAEEKGFSKRREVLAANLDRYLQGLACERPWPLEDPVFALPSFRNIGL